MKTTVIGSDNVGLVSGAGLADRATTSCTSTSILTSIAMLEGGEILSYEPGLAETVRHTVAPVLHAGDALRG
jgi:UDP-glucose 6-dehydrogenase